MDVVNLFIIIYFSIIFILYSKMKRVSEINENKGITDFQKLLLFQCSFKEKGSG